MMLTTFHIGKHRVNVEKVVEQGKPQFFGVAGKCLSLDLQIGIHHQYFGLAGKCWVPCVSPYDDNMDIIKLPLTTYLFDQKCQDLKEYPNLNGNQAAVPRIF